MSDPVLIAGFIALFVAIGGVFLAANLLVGWLVRPRMPNTEKLEVYECGEPTIGSSFVQFDLRFYVVALLFIIFDVERAEMIKTPSYDLGISREALIASYHEKLSGIAKRSSECPE